jgi:hypothetical protein
MGRAEHLRAAHEAEVAVAELEDELVRLKGLKRPNEEKLQQTKLALREARARFRELRAGGPVPEGDAVASPATIEASASVKGPGEGA